MGLIWAVATVNLPGLPRGTAALVDVERASIRRRIAAGYLRVCTSAESAKLDSETGRRGETDG